MRSAGRSGAAVGDVDNAGDGVGLAEVDGAVGWRAVAACHPEDLEGAAGVNGGEVGAA